METSPEPAPARALSTEAVAAFRRDGFCIVRGFFDAAQMADLRRWLDALEAVPETPGQERFYYEDSVTDGDHRVLSRIEYFADFQPDLGALLRGPALCDPVSTLFGEPAILFKEKVNLKLPGGQGFEPHQDAQAGWDVYGSRHITVMITIDPATLENGCLELASGHQDRGLIGRMWEPLSEAELDGVAFVPYPTAPGDAAFFDSYTPHRSAPNRTVESRRILYLTYGRRADGDQRERYFADKRKNLPPDIEREAGKEYRYKV